MNWLISIFKPGHVNVLKIGARVRLPDGREGVVTGGAVHIDLDVKPGEFRLNWTTGLTKVKVL